MAHSKVVGLPSKDFVPAIPGGSMAMTQCHNSGINHRANLRIVAEGIDTENFFAVIDNGNGRDIYVAACHSDGCPRMHGAHSCGAHDPSDDENHHRDARYDMEFRKLHAFYSY